MYSVKNLINKNPIQLSTAVMAIVNFCIIVHWLTLHADAVAALNTVLVLVFGLFVTTQTTNTSKLNDLVAINTPGE